MTPFFKLATSKMWQFKNWLKGVTFKAFIARPIICLTSASLLLLEQAHIVHQKVKLVRVPEGGDRVHPMPRRHNFLKSELFSHCLPTMSSLTSPPALRKNIDQFSELPGRRTRVPGCRVDCEETAEKEDVPSKDLSSRAHTQAPPPSSPLLLGSSENCGSADSRWANVSTQRDNRLRWQLQVSSYSKSAPSFVYTWLDFFTIFAEYLICFGGLLFSMSTTQVSSQKQDIAISRDYFLPDGD